jgi:hypothetical protein
MKQQGSCNPQEQQKPLNFQQQQQQQLHQQGSFNLNYQQQQQQQQQEYFNPYQSPLVYGHHGQLHIHSGTGQGYSYPTATPNAVPGVGVQTPVITFSEQPSSTGLSDIASALFLNRQQSRWENIMHSAENSLKDSELAFNVLMSKKK